jgi:GntR family transcriptional regulator/MocR family aminotransferase
VNQSKTTAVVERVRTMIADGVLREGDPLPSTRAMAAELGIARGTVVAAYEQLDGEGWIRTRHGAAARVATRAPGTDIARREVPDSAPGPRPRAVSGTPRGGALIDLRPGIPAVTAIAARDWRSAWRAAADLPFRNALADPMGTRDLREQIAAQLGLTRGFAPHPDRVIITAGTSEAMSLITEALPGSPVLAVENPGYRSGRRAISSAGGTLAGVPVDEDGMDLARIPTGVDAIVVTPTHQYPLGSVMPIARRLELLDLAAARGTIVVEDDYDSEFRHRGDPLPALAALDNRGSVVHVGTFSKVLDPRLRCGWIVAPPGGSFADALRTAREARGPVVAEPVQAAVAHLLRTGALRRHLGRVRRDYAHKRSRIAARVAELGDLGLEARALSGGLHAVLTWPGPPSPAEVLRRLEDRGFLLADLARYAVTPDTALPGIVLGYGAASAVDLDRALDVLAEVLRAPAAPRSPE